MARDPTTVDTRALGRTDMTREKIVMWFDRRRQAWDHRDARTLAADYAPHAVVESPMGGTHEGRTAIEAVFQAFFDAFEDMKVTADRLVIDGEAMVQIRTIEGTNIGVFLGLQPTGKPFHFTLANVYDLQGGQIVCERRIYDFTGLLVQIGALKAKPV